MKIAITGGIGSGKSHVGQILREKGYQVVDTDQVAKALMMPGGKNYQKILEHFGRNLLLPNGEIDSKALRTIIFNDHEKRRQLNALTHGAIMEEAFNQCEEGSITFVEVPLLFEEGLEGLFDETWVLTARDETKRSRIAKRGGLNPLEVERIMESQWRDIERIKVGNVVIDSESKSLVEIVEKRLAALEKSNHGK